MFNFKPVIKGNVKGLKDTHSAAIAATHSQPILTFGLSGQLWVDENQNLVEPYSKGAKLESVVTEYHLAIEPKNLLPEHGNRIQAMTTRINSGQRMNEKMALAVANAEGSKRVTKADLPDEDLMMGLYVEFDNAQDARLVAVAAKDEYGNTLWDYKGPNGESVQLTAEFLRSNLRAADAINNAFNTWFSPTTPSLGAATLTKEENSTKDSTQKIPAPSSSDSHTSSTAEERSEPIIQE